MGSLLSKSISKEQLEMAVSKVKTIVNSNPVVVFSKTYCGYCKRVKQLLTQLGATYKVIELDEGTDGDETQAALAEWTGQRTVPNVFIGGKHIGGCDSVLEKHQAGLFCPFSVRLVPLPLSKKLHSLMKR
ncbi:glutaredoxin [Prunus yedoensis var. nudiflora]|uniref:Glutaredoxin n=1 Tax=Prunus yedoensis var. nudiflora TaxID=2094558 RepID=A0A314Y518_PRUYE|nr:glutaredoxin [Prunus yedoensis var. nudiflora]